MPSFAYVGRDDRFIDYPTVTMEAVNDHFTFVARGQAIGLTFMISGHLSQAAAQQAAAAPERPHLHLTDVLHETGLHEATGVADQVEEWETYDYEVPEVLWPQIRQYLQETLDKMAK